MNAKKKMLCTALFVMLILWATSHQSPIQLLVNFVVAGSLPGFEISLSPYIMFGLALIGGTALLAQLYLQNNDPTRVLVEAPAEALAPRSRVKSKKAQPKRKRTTATTHSRSHRTTRAKSTRTTRTSSRAKNK